MRKLSIKNLVKQLVGAKKHILISSLVVVTIVIIGLLAITHSNPNPTITQTSQAKTNVAVEPNASEGEDITSEPPAQPATDTSSQNNTNTVPNTPNHTNKALAPLPVVSDAERNASICRNSENLFQPQLVSRDNQITTDIINEINSQIAADSTYTSPESKLSRINQESVRANSLFDDSYRKYLRSLSSGCSPVITAALQIPYCVDINLCVGAVPRR